MTKLSSFNRECLALGFEEEFWSLKHQYSPSEASKLREKEVSSTENVLAPAGVGFGTEILRGSGGTVYVDRKRCLNTGGGLWQLATGSQGWQEVKAVLLWSQF